MKHILQKLFPKTCDSIWQDGYDAGLTDGFEHASVVAHYNDVFILPKGVGDGKVIIQTGGNA